MTRRFCTCEHICHHWFEDECSEACARGAHEHPHGSPDCSDEHDLKTSSEWETVTGILILDPDGWDRQNLAESWAEMISRRGFERRAMVSTHTTDPDRNQ